MKPCVHRPLIALLIATAVALGGCASPKPGPDRYAAFKAARPASILVLPPLNESPDINATPNVLAQATLPLAESGYYVVPVGVMMETFRQNGLTQPAEIQDVPLAKLRQIYGADAALYIKVTQFGSQYTVLDSVVRVSASARLVDLRSGQTLWAGSASASDNEGQRNNSGLIVAVLGAVVKQVINSSTDAAHPIAGVMDNRLLRANPSRGGLMFGPRSPAYAQQFAERPTER